MFSNVLISVLFSLGFSAWVYNKIQRQTGGNTGSSLTVAGVSGVAVFIIFLILLNFLT